MRLTELTRASIILGYIYKGSQVVVSCCYMLFLCFPLAYSDSDSDWSSLERRQRAADMYCKVNRKGTPHKRVRKKRTAIPVATPRVPSTALVGGAGQATAPLLSYQMKEEAGLGPGADSPGEKGIAQ